LDVLRGHCAAVGRDFDRIKKTWQCECAAVARTEEEARRMAEASPFYTAPESALIGTPDQVAEQIRQWASLGVSHMQIRFTDFPQTDGIRLFMDAVMPQFA